MHWYIKVLKNYIGFQGRARRKEYWMFVLLNSLITVILSIVESSMDFGSVLTNIYSLAVLLPFLAVSVRRLHDTGRSGWSLLVLFIPLIGIYVLRIFEWFLLIPFLFFILFISVIELLIYMCKDSQESANQYGKNPKN